jgi:hypothetical protein
MLAGSNTLRRPVDRIEGAILMALLAVFGVAVAVASIVGSPTRTSRSMRRRPACARPRPC